MTGSNETPTEPAIAPTPKQVDALILEHAAAQAELQSGGAIKKLAGESAADIEARYKTWETEADGIRKAAQLVAEEVKGRLVAMVTAHGLKHAEKSLKLFGEHGWAMTTTATRVETVATAVDTFKTRLEKSKIPGIAGLFFTKHVSYSLVAGPTEVLKTLSLSARLRTRLTVLLALCFEVKTNAPSLKTGAVAAAKPAKTA